MNCRLSLWLRFGICDYISAFGLLHLTSCFIRTPQIGMPVQILTCHLKRKYRVHDPQNLFAACFDNWNEIHQLCYLINRTLLSELILADDYVSIWRDELSGLHQDCFNVINSRLVGISICFQVFTAFTSMVKIFLPDDVILNYRNIATFWDLTHCSMVTPCNVVDLVHYRQYLNQRWLIYSWKMSIKLRRNFYSKFKYFRRKMHFKMSLATCCPCFSVSTNCVTSYADMEVG